MDNLAFKTFRKKWQQLPLHQLGEGRLGLVPGELLQQFEIRRIAHCTLICAPNEKGNAIFIAQNPAVPGILTEIRRLSRGI